MIFFHNLMLLNAPKVNFDEVKVIFDTCFSLNIMPIKCLNRCHKFSLLKF